jgi:L-fucose isomerase-like protein
MNPSTLKIAYCPTRRDVFSRESARQHAEIIRRRLASWDVDLVDLSGINAEGLLFQDEDLEPVIARFRAARVDALFFPHCNFGSEGLVAQVAAAFKLPTLLWGPRDEGPDPAGMRQRDSQCGLFATGKALRRFNVPFTYLTNSWVDGPEFEIGFKKFLAVANAVRSVRGLRILQISTRPQTFLSVMVNEGELLERFGIQIVPIPLPELIQEMDRVQQENGADYRDTAVFIHEKISRNSPIEQINRMAALKVAMRNKAAETGSRAVAIQCWNALQDMTGIMPCLANALLADEGLPVACETDIHGAVTAVLLRAAAMDVKPHFFSDVTIRHPGEDNAELLWHCGPFPYSLAKDKACAKAGAHWILASKAYGTCEWEIIGGDITIARFDGDHGEYRLFIGEGVGTDGPKTGGTYLWFKVGNWAKWEHKLVRGPYIHHVVGIHGRYGEILLEACRYLNGLVADPVEPTEQELSERWY